MGATSVTRYTVCPYNCWPINCGMAVTTADGKGIDIRGNPHHDVSQGRLCVKGQSAGQILSSPDRVTTPLIRDGDRGTGRFKPISWDAALDHIAARMTANIETHRPQANALYHSHGNIVQRINWTILTPRFANLAGMTLWDGNVPCWYDVGLAQHLTGYYGLHDPEDMGTHSQAVVNWAQDPCASQANLVPYLLRVRERGGLVVTIDPRVTQTAAISDLHIRPRLGTDAWLANAVAHILFGQRVVDIAAVKGYSLGLDAYRDHVNQCSPAEAANVCGIPLSDIERLARIFAEMTPLCINLSRGALGKHAGGVQMVRAILCLIPLTKNLGVRGGGAIWGEAIDWQLDLRLQHRRPAVSYPENNYRAIDTALEAGAVDTLLVVGGNPLSQWPDLNRLRSQLHRVGCIVVNDLFINHTAREVADIILPATSWLEELGLRTSGRRIYLMDNILEPVGNCREASAWMADLAARLGIPDYFPWKDKEACLDDCLNTPACHRATVAALRTRPDGILADLPEIPYADQMFDTPSKKFEFWAKEAEPLGLDPLPTYVLPQESPEATPDLARRFPLQLISSRRNTHFHSFHDSHRAIPLLRSLEPAPLLQMHPLDAAKRQILDGAWAVMRNDRGQCRVAVEVTTEVAPGHVSLNDGWPALNEVTAAFCPVSPDVTSVTGLGGQPAYQNVLVEIEREGR